MRARLIIVSNRLPVSISRSDNGFDVRPSVGGLATGLASYAGKRGTVWVGWPGLPSDGLTESDKQQITTKLKKLGCHPVFLSKQQLADFYSGYSNSVLWPLLHEQAPAAHQPRSWWQGYQAVNELFAGETRRFTEASTRIWVHDYQLLLLPGLLRAALPATQIGFFLHIPFPPTESFGKIRQHKQLLRGVLGADLVGLHTSGYCQNFLATVNAAGIGTSSGDQTIALRSHACRVSDFPMGIDYAKFQRAVKTRAVQTSVRKLAYRYRGKKVILSVDRLDPTKGLYERLQAYQQLLAGSPNLKRKIVFVMLAVPSRTEIPAYQELKKRVEALVIHINQQYGTSLWQPVEYLYKSMSFEQLSALYRRADVAFIAPLRDGMNLVAKEYVASKHGRDGVLVLSSTAGAAEELKGAVMVDPTKPSSLVRGLRRALTMPRSELRKRLRDMQEHLAVATVQSWAHTFIDDLRRPLAGVHRTKQLTTSERAELVAAYKAAKQPLLLFDYDGTLTPIVSRPEDAAPTPELLTLLRRLAKRASVVVLSGRSRADLERWLGKIPVTLIAEHGATMRNKTTKKWTPAPGLSTDWQPRVLKLLQKAAKAVPGSHVEQKTWALVWHYRQSTAYRAEAQLALLRAQLRVLQTQHDFKVKTGKKIIEVSPAAISKGRAATDLLAGHDFVLAAGDDTTDEDMLRALPESSWTIKIGRGKTAAHYRLSNPAELLSVFDDLR